MTQYPWRRNTILPALLLIGAELSLAAALVAAFLVLRAGGNPWPVEWPWRLTWIGFSMALAAGLTDVWARYLGRRRRPNKAVAPPIRAILALRAIAAALLVGGALLVPVLGWAQWLYGAGEDAPGAGPRAISEALLISLAVDALLILHVTLMLPFTFSSRPTEDEFPAVPSPRNSRFVYHLGALTLVALAAMAHHTQTSGG